MYIEDTIYLGYDNQISWRLFEANAQIDHSLITRVRLHLDATHVVDSMEHSALFDFTHTDKFSMRLGSLGSSALPVGVYNANLVIYTTAQPSGIVWEPSIVLNVVQI